MERSRQTMTPQTETTPAPRLGCFAQSGFDMLAAATQRLFSGFSPTMNIRNLWFFSCAILALPLAPLAAKTADGHPKLVLMAGKPSHPPRQHEYNAGVQLLAKALAQGAPQVKVEVVLNGWPKDESVLEGADAVVFFMDGGAKHETVQESGARLKRIEGWVQNGMSIGAIHYGVE